MLQLLLMALGLAFLMRNVIAFVAGTETARTRGERHGVASRRHCTSAAPSWIVILAFAAIAAWR